MVITINFKDGSKTITFAEIEAAEKGSDFTDFGAPCKKPLLSIGQKRFFTMISVPRGTGDILLRNMISATRMIYACGV